MMVAIALRILVVVLVLEQILALTCRCGRCRVAPPRRPIPRVNHVPYATRVVAIHEGQTAERPSQSMQ